jgi:hypothetical protein
MTMNAAAENRSLRPLPVREGGKVRHRFAVLVDGERIGEVRCVRLRGTYGGQARYCWFGNLDADGRLASTPMNSREEAAKFVIMRRDLRAS